MARRGYPGEFRQRVLELVASGRKIFDVARDPQNGLVRHVRLAPEKDPLVMMVWVPAESAESVSVSVPGKTGQWGFRGSPDQTDMRAPCRCQSPITSLPTSGLCAREADSGWLCSRKLQRPQRHMGSAFKRCRPLRHRRNEPAVCRCPS